MRATDPTFNHSFRYTSINIRRSGGILVVVVSSWMIAVGFIENLHSGSDYSYTPHLGGKADELTLETSQFPVYSDAFTSHIGTILFSQHRSVRWCVSTKVYLRSK